MTTVHIAKPEPRRPVTFRAPFACPRCGGPRAVFAFGLDPSREVAERWRHAGPCRSCKVRSFYRIVDEPERWRVDVREEGKAA